MNRRLLQWGVIAIAIAVAVYTGGFEEDGQQPQPSASSDAPFDFYVLALSWSPAFCASERGQNADQQCGPGTDFGFITHGLWPQFEQGWPSFCQSPHGDRMTRAGADTLLPIMPDRGLIEHQWDKHGTCSGLNQASYADLVVQATRSITVPAAFAGQPPSHLSSDDIERAFMDANAGLDEDELAIVCPGGRLTEVRICLDQNLAPRMCREVNENGCGQNNLRITPR